ncbi:hypothetical protein PPYR_14902 [Photinus pyralis]|uniref:Thioredoxin domain-containing protein n=1 Tax=Photinus pyralis TaxID=7054 RepID=A0A1Y1K2X5_PHOPY|nr:thioredoxin domain-containing protein 5 homolog [Photinus pyralis]KAB0790649.1 hypothetical protein PPYR_14902 [Photinus pyralis]
MNSVLHLILVIFSIFICAQTHENDVYTVQYNTDNYSEEISKRNHFIMFYAPWCGHCQRLGPIWEQLAEMLNEDDTNIRIAKVDCTVDSKICSDEDVTGYPTLKFFKLGNNVGEKFRGTRDLPSLTSFINEQLRSAEEDDTVKVPQPLQGLIELTDENFEKHVSSGKHFVKFYAPWCGHCQKLAPVWERLAESLEFEPEVSVAKIDCTQFRSICNNFDIKGYPTLLWLEDGKRIDKYQGQRTHEELKTYVNKMLGSNKADVNEQKSETVSSSAVMILTGDDFNHGIEKGITFVKFFAPWCGHCKRLAPTWEDLAKKFVDNPQVHIVKVDCTLEVNKQLCNDEEVDGFPSVFLYKNGKKISEYNGNRSLEDLKEFIESHAHSRDEL